MTTLVGAGDTTIDQPRAAGGAALGDQFLGQLRLRAWPPTVPAGFVERRRLTDLLTAGSARQVTLISAGAGHGKTLTVASWARGGHAPGTVVWLTVDESDNDLQAFWSDVLGALAVNGAVPAGSPLSEVVPAAGFGERQSVLVQAGLAELQGVVTLVLDDFHRITDSRVLASFGRLLEHQPRQLRLVLSTRLDPALRLHRLRVSGGVTDIRAADLAFTAPEAAELFDINGIHLSADQLKAVSDRTQGWAAGLRLALMTLDRADIDAGISRFTGSLPPVAEYLIEEVIDRLPPTDRQFLLGVSVADRVSVALARELTGRPDSQLILERLASQHALVVGLAGRNEWFTLHPLLREVLSHRLALEQPDTVAALYLRASRWFAGQGEPIPAIRYATAAEAWDEVGRLMALALPQLLTPNAAALASALAPAVARARVQPSTSTLLASACVHFHRHDYASMSREVEDANDLLIGGTPGHLRAAELVTAVLRVVHARVRNPARIAPDAKHLMDLVDSTPRDELPTAEHFRMIADNNIALGQLWGGDLAAAERSLCRVQARSQELGLGLMELSTQAHLAMLDVIHGRLHTAHQVAVETEDLAHRKGWASEPQALGLYCAAALTYLEWDRLDAAAEQIHAGLAVSNSGSDVACRLVLAIAAVGVAVAGGDARRCRAAADALDSIRSEAVELPPFLARWCTVARADVLVATGDSAAAIRLIGEWSAPGGYPEALERVAVAKARLSLHEPEAALAVLDPVVRSADHIGPAVEAQILTAVSADLVHRDVAAITAISDAVDLAEGAGFIRPFRAAGPRVRALLIRHRHTVARNLDFTAALIGSDEAGEIPVGTPAPVEPLTERERAVLNYLPTMYKAGEIAADLFISVNTVKSHQQSLYRKLGVATRRAAVDRARDLNLL